MNIQLAGANMIGRGECVGGGNWSENMAKAAWDTTSAFFPSWTTEYHIDEEKSADDARSQQPEAEIIVCWTF